MRGCVTVARCLAAAVAAAAAALGGAGESCGDCAACRGLGLRDTLCRREQNLSVLPTALRRRRLVALAQELCRQGHFRKRNVARGEGGGFSIQKTMVTPGVTAKRFQL